MKKKTLTAALAALARRRRRRRDAGRGQERDRHRHDAGPVGPDRRLLQAGASTACTCASTRSTSRAASTAASSSWWSRTRLRPEEGRAGGAEAGEAGQDLRHGRPHRHGAEHGRDADPVREERDQLVPAHRGARDVRAAAPAEVLVRGDLLRPDARGACPSSSRRRAPRRSARCTRTTISASK